MSESRLMDLEIKVAYLEKLVADLDGVIRDQAKRIARLSTIVDAGGDARGGAGGSDRGQRFSLDSTGAPGAGADVHDDKPPHY